MPQVKTVFDTPYELVRGLAFADLRPEPVEEAFFNFNRTMQAAGLPRRVQWLNFVQGEYLDIIREAQQQRWDEATLEGEPERIDTAISRATKFVERYLEKEMPELAYRWQTYLTMPERDNGSETLLNQFDGVTGCVKLEAIDPFKDPLQISHPNAAKLLDLSPKYLSSQVKKYAAFPQPFQRSPKGHWYFWLDEILAFKRGELFATLKQESLAKGFDSKQPKNKLSSSNPVEGLKKVPKDKRPAKRTDPKGSSKRTKPKGS